MGRKIIINRANQSETKRLWFLDNWHHNKPLFIAANRASTSSSYRLLPTGSVSQSRRWVVVADQVHNGREFNWNNQQASWGRSDESLNK